MVKRLCQHIGFKLRFKILWQLIVDVLQLPGLNCVFFKTFFSRYLNFSMNWQKLLINKKN